MRDGEAFATSTALHERVREFARGAGGDSFEELAWAIARFQRARVPSFAALFGQPPFASASQDSGPLWQIPALPVEVMRFSPVFTFDPETASHVFETSGTTSRETGLHYVRRTDTYRELCLPVARAHLNPESRPFIAVALMPLARANTRSSLAFMVRRLIEVFDGRGLTETRQVSQFDVEDSRRWLLDEAGVNVAELRRVVDVAVSCGHPVLLFTTSFALAQLMDLLENDSLPLPPHSVVMPTGGFKGRAREVDAEALHSHVQRKLGPVSIVQEYGMTELCSQLWERTHPALPKRSEAGLYFESPTLRVIPVDAKTMLPVPDGEPGLASFIDLGNVDSAVRILTEDRVVRDAFGVRLLGRSPRAMLRGCSLAAENFIVPQADRAMLRAPVSRPRAVPEARIARVRQLVDAARTLSDRTTLQGKRLRQRLNEQALLSPEGIEHALQECLETHPSEAELQALLGAVEPAPRVWVVSSANVFVAAHRAIALGLAAAGTVLVRPSTRDSALTEALSELCPDLFSIATGVEAEPGDHVYAYGSDTTMRALLGTLPEGVVFHAHGHGFGVVWLDETDDVAAVARDIAKDAAVFDQRGCASPRVVALGCGVDADAFTDALRNAFEDLSTALPMGRLSFDEVADVVRFRLLARSVADAVVEIGSSSVVLQRAPAHVLLPPIGRHLVLVSGKDALARLVEAKNLVTTVAVQGSELQQRRVRELFPRARICRPGYMQRPPFDGPIDLRSVPQVVGRPSSEGARDG